MCGIVAFIGDKPDVALLATLAYEAGRRGPDGSGWAALVAGDWIVKRDHRVPLVDLPPPPEIADATIVLGHSRLATDDGRDVESRCQPLAAGDDFVIFNGRLPGRWPNGDGAELAAYLEKHGPRQGITEYFDVAAQLGSERQAVIAAERDRLHVGILTGFYGAMPVHTLHRDEGWYLCSRPFPDSTPMPDRTGVTTYEAPPHEPEP